MQWMRTLPVGEIFVERESKKEEKKIEFWFSWSGSHGCALLFFFASTHLHYWYRSQWILMRCRSSERYPSTADRQAEIPYIYVPRQDCVFGVCEEEKKRIFQHHHAGNEWEKSSSPQRRHVSIVTMTCVNLSESAAFGCIQDMSDSH